MTTKSNLYIDKIEFKNGQSLNLKKNSIVVFVGPNNVGKSRTLKEISELAQSEVYNPDVIKILNSISITVEGTLDDLYTKIDHRKRGEDFIYPTIENNMGMSKSGIEMYWNTLKDGKITTAPGIAQFFIKNMSTIERLNLVLPVKNIDFLQELKSHPIHDLKQDFNKEKTFSKYFKQAFGEDIIVNHNYGSLVVMHVGMPPVITIENDRASSEYQAELRKLPFLHEQGDGMKSFAGVFLGLFSQDISVNIIDEPEAFLHPPQAILLGEMISKIGSDKQMFIATHSEHLLKGLLDGERDRLVIIRIQREEDLNSINILENEEIMEVWNDTLLRHSNVLDGLFHKEVVLVESDSDCQFYKAILSTIIEPDAISSPDILFIPSGGKDRFPVIIKALKALEVPAKIIGDFDLYNNENPIRKIYELLGGKWDDIKSDFFKVKKGIDEKVPELKTEDVRKQVLEILDSCDERFFPETKIKAINEVLKKTSPWKQAKSSGKHYLPAGEIMNAFIRVQNALKEKNIIVLDIGEIEAFDKTTGGHGPKWVNQVLQKDLLLSDDLKYARDFVRKSLLTN